MGLLRAGLDVFRFTGRDLDLDTSVTMFPGLTNFGDLRVQYDLTFAWEMFADVDWELSFYADYDSAAPDEGSETDYGINTGLVLPESSR